MASIFLSDSPRQEVIRVPQNSIRLNSYRELPVSYQYPRGEGAYVDDSFFDPVRLKQPHPRAKQYLADLKKYVYEQMSRSMSVVNDLAVVQQMIPLRSSVFVLPSGEPFGERQMKL